MEARLVHTVRDWVADDPDPGTRRELEALLEAGDEAALRDRVDGRLRFGTAGLRGPLRGGPNGMNRAVVRRAAAGLAAHLGPGRTVAVGYDARHGSAAFAEDSARVLAGAGLRAVVLPRALPTPVLAFAVRELGADAGVMVTASHNPPRDNGYKVYLGDGAQIVPPVDREIEDAIGAVGRLAELPLAPVADVERADDALVDAYLDATAALSLVPDRDVRVAYTPLHGVGRDPLLALFQRAGFPAPAVEAAQGNPDPDFPTVTFPNPEEAGAMDRALALGRASKADVVIANDPDADRCAVAVGDRLLRGDELGALLADHVLRHRPGPVATSIVSATLLDRLAAAHGVACHRTLTGFKWIARADPNLAYGYEEALGYAVGPHVVRDKDGLSAALLAAELAASCRAAGRTLLHRLDDLEREHGVHATAQHAVRVADPADISAAMERLRAAPAAAFGSRRVREATDLLAGGAGLPAADVLVYDLDDARVVIRPSGTEPKLKAYLEVVEAVAGDLGAARGRAHAALEELEAAVAAAIGL